MKPWARSVSSTSFAMAGAREAGGSFPNRSATAEASVLSDTPVTPLNRTFWIRTSGEAK